MFTCLLTGVLVIVANYFELLPGGEAQNSYLFVGLGADDRGVRPLDPVPLRPSGPPGESHVCNYPQVFPQTVENSGRGAQTGTMSSRQWRGASGSSPPWAAVITTSAPQTMHR